MDSIVLHIGCDVDHSVVSQNSGLNCPYYFLFCHHFPTDQGNAEVIVAHQEQAIARGTDTVNL